MSGRIRWMCLMPTESMTALTKTMIAEPMMKLLTTFTCTYKMDQIEEHHFDMTTASSSRRFPSRCFCGICQAQVHVFGTAGHYSLSYFDLLGLLFGDFRQLR